MADSHVTSADLLAPLLDLGHRVRSAGSVAELEFMLVNDSHALAPYRQAAFWLSDNGCQCLSGVVQIEANAPYILWLGKVCKALDVDMDGNARSVTSADLDGKLGEEWDQWFPEHGLWVPLPRCPGGLLLARDLPWSRREIALLQEWADLWSHGWKALQTNSIFSLARFKGWLFGSGRSRGQTLRWLRSSLLTLFALMAMSLPVHLTVMAPGELVPVSPAVIRAPLEGVIDSFHVQPNERVTKGQTLFGFDKTLITARLEVARQALATAETEYRQTAQLALSDARVKSQLAVLAGKIEERRAETGFLADQLARTSITAPQDGIALFDDPSQWIGKPVTIGERVMRIATPEHVEIEVWVNVGDAIPLEANAAVSFYLSASPLEPVAGQLRYMAHDAIERPDGSFAYRARATLVKTTDHRVGQRGTAKLQGQKVSLVYWISRRPLAGLRAMLGI
nr:HlyD family efflux transporter periplasmic adaptor subunit [uncultured Cohaesibacter sp.]